MKLQPLSQQEKESLFLYCVFFSVCGGMQQPSLLCRQRISVRTPPAASGLRSGPAGWFGPEQEFPSSCSWPGLAGTEHAFGVGKWTSCGFHLSPAAVLSLHVPCVKPLVAGAKGVLQLFLALPSSYAQLPVQGSPLFSSLPMVFLLR